MKKKCILLASLSIIILIILVTLKDRNNNYTEDISSSKNTDIPLESSISKLSFIATGDALVHGALYKDAYKNGEYDFKYQITNVKEIVEKFDLAFYNQETIFAGKEIGYSHYPRFNTPSEFGDAMLDAGFNIVALANNHSFDKGDAGILNALKYFKNTNILYNGLNETEDSQEEFQIKEVNGIKYTMISFTTYTNIGSKNKYLVNYYSKEKALSMIANAKKQTNLIIVSIHWGIENSHEENDKQRKIAKELSEMGVNILIGHHPHVLQPIEYIGNTLIMYSLGNFISAQKTADQLTGVLVSFDISKDNNEITLGDIKADLIYSYRNNNHKNIKVIPYSKITNNDLKNYEEVYSRNKAILNKYFKVNVTPCNKDN